MNALNGFLMIQRQMTLKVYNVRKLHRPRISDGFLTDTVDTTFASLVVQHLQLFSELHNQLANLERHA